MAKRKLDTVIRMSSRTLKQLRSIGDGRPYDRIIQDLLKYFFDDQEDTLKEYKRL